MGVKDKDPDKKWQEGTPCTWFTNAPAVAKEGFDLYVIKKYWF